MLGLLAAGVFGSARAGAELDVSGAAVVADLAELARCCNAVEVR